MKTPSSTSTTPDTGLGGGSPNPAFVTTHWSVVLAAGHGDSTHARDALSRLCEVYWYPLYAFVRRRGYDAHDAKDLTQEFFVRLLEGNWVAQADRERGRFRSFLLGAMKHFLANEWHKARTLKRGGQCSVISLSEGTAEARYAREPVTETTPETLFERRWATALLEDVLEQLEAEYRREGKGDLFADLRHSLTTSRSAVAYTELATKLGLSEGAVRVAVHRLRQDYRARLRAAVAHTVASPAEVEEEMQHLFRVLMES